MRQSSRAVLVAALASIALRTPVHGQQKAALTKPDAETSESFTRLISIRELPSGKVLVADISDKTVQLVDLASGTMTKVGREGNGPGEYAFPRSLIGLPDGSTLVHDLLNRRFLVISPDGKPGAFLEMPRPPATTTTTQAPGPLGGITNIGGVDDRGRIYFEGSPFSATGGSNDSVPILRWDRVKPTFDTVGYRKLPPNTVSSSGGGGNLRVTIGGGKRFAPAEAWSVAGDGSVARVFPEPYRVAWLSGKGPAQLGAVVPYTPMKVTEADKQQFIEAQKKQVPLRITIGDGPRPGAGGGGGGNFTPPPPEFADTKPPFDGAGASVLATPDGEVWVLRTRPASDKVLTYDVFDRTAALVKRVSLNPDSRVVGFGKGTVYVIRTDADDLQYLQRYKRP